MKPFNLALPRCLLSILAIVSLDSIARADDEITLIRAAELADRHLQTQTHNGNPLNEQFVISQLARVFISDESDPISIRYDPKIAWRATLTPKPNAKNDKSGSNDSDSAPRRMAIDIRYDGTTELVNAPIIRKRIVLPKGVTQ